MDQYVRSLLFSSVIAGMLEAFLPAEGAKRHLRFLLSCIMILVLLAPVIQAFLSTYSIEIGIQEFLAALETAEDQGAEFGKDLVMSYSEATVSDFVKDKLQEEFSVLREEMEVFLETIDGETVLHVVLRGRASWIDGTRVAAFLKEQLNCSIKVTRK